MSKRMILIGKVGSGKTTLINTITNGETYTGKTQDVNFYDGFIDTPGEYLELRSMLNALIVTSADADIIGLIHACGDVDMRIPPSFASLFSKDVIGIVSKSDLARTPSDLLHTRDILENAGAAPIFEVSIVTGEGLAELDRYLKQS